MAAVPTYLKEVESLWRKDPHAAGLKWFEGAAFGLFIHYGLYSLLGRGEWVMYKDRIHVADYERLADRFTAENFDAEAIAGLAQSAGCRYINLVTRHHDSFCLFNTKQTDFHSLNAACRRDFVAEFAEACEKRGMGLFLYYSYGADWRHPYFYPEGRPRYTEPEPAYRYEKPDDFHKYIDFMHAQLTELLTQYGSVAGIWLDLISACYYYPDRYPVEETYDLIRSLQPQCLISFKQGATGTEDYMSQEIVFRPLKERLIRGGASEEAVEMSERIWRMHEHKHNEVCTTMQKKGWAYEPDAEHRSADEVEELLRYTAQNNCNLLLNIGPLPDGSVHPDDRRAFEELAARRMRP